MSIRSTGFFVPTALPAQEIIFSTQDISIAGVSFTTEVPVVVGFNTSNMNMTGIGFAIEILNPVFPRSGFFLF